MQVIELEQNDCESKAIVHTENVAKNNTIHSVNDNLYSNLKWEDIAGLDWNIIERNEQNV